MNFQLKKVLFISVSFFSYEKAIAKRLEELGAEVDFFDDRPSNSVFSRGIIRFNKNFLNRKIKKYYNKILEEIKEKKYNYFLLVKGEAIPEFFLQKIKVMNPEMQMICYTYDSCEEHPRFKDLIKFFDKKFTFDRNDAKNFGLSFRPLFFVKDYLDFKENSPETNDLAFVGTAHTDRYFVGKNVKTECDNKNLKSYFYYYSPSRTAFYLKRFFDKNFKKFVVKDLSFEKLSHKKIIEIYQNSKSVLDINKPYQNGLTMRTFEVLANQRKLITTNPDIVNYPFYNPKNILVINRENPIIPNNFLKEDIVKMDEKTIYMMSLDSWIDCLFFKKQDDYWNP